MNTTSKILVGIVSLLIVFCVSLAIVIVNTSKNITSSLTSVAGIVSTAKVDQVTSISKVELRKAELNAEVELRKINIEMDKLQYVHQLETNVTMEIEQEWNKKKQSINQSSMVTDLNKRIEQRNAQSNSLERVALLNLDAAINRDKVKVDAFIAAEYAATKKDVLSKYGLEKSIQPKPETTIDGNLLIVDAAYVSELLRDIVKRHDIGEFNGQLITDRTPTLMDGKTPLVQRYCNGKIPVYRRQNGTTGFFLVSVNNLMRNPRITVIEN